MSNGSNNQLNQQNNQANMLLSIENGWLCQREFSTTDNELKVQHLHSPHFTPREQGEVISLLVVHNISLPPGKFCSNHISDFFLGCLNKNDDPYFETIHEMKVSAHCLIRRNGEIIQYVSFLDKAWHAGISSYKGRDKCNDYSIGIELEGTDDIPYTNAQYEMLAFVSSLLKKEYSAIASNIVGHCDIAPGRKTDPGGAFDWHQFKSWLNNIK